MVDSPHPAQLRGRRRDPAKREALLDAARELFLRGGAETVTMDDVIVAAGVARATLYAYFPNRAALFEAMVARDSERAVPDDWEQDKENPVAALIACGERLLTFLYSDQTLGLERIIQGAARTFPDLASRFYEAGPGRGRAVIRRLIISAQNKGAVGPCDLEVAVDDLMGLWLGFLRVELAFRRRPAPKPDELRERAEHGVAQFLRLYGVADPSTVPAPKGSPDNK